MYTINQKQKIITVPPQQETQEEDEGGGGDVKKVQGNTDLLKKQISHYQKKLTTLQKVAHISQQADSK